MENFVSDAVDIVKSRYSSKQVVDDYSKVDMYPAEEILIFKYFTPGQSILDLGCGAGRTSIALAKKKYNVIGIDFSHKMIQSAKKQASSHNVDLEFYVQDATKLNYQKASFNNILFSYNGIEHIPGNINRLRVLKSAFNILKPGGYFIFTTRSGLAFGSRRAIMWIWLLIEFIYRRYIKADKIYELGDRVRKRNYFYYTNPFIMRKAAIDIGFKCKYFNSEQNIVNGKRSSIFTNFSSDRMLFYVFQKP